MADYNRSPIPDARSAAGGLGDAKSRLLAGFSRVLDAIEPQIDRAPPNMQSGARKAVAVARDRPLLTMAGLALGALVLARGAQRRR